MSTQITTHVDDAIARLSHQFKDQPNIAALATAWVASTQEVETALWQLLTERAIDTAIGVHLDAIGTIVGQPRNGYGDEDYRRFIRARVATNRSRGTGPEILHIAALVLNDPDAYLQLDNQGTAAYVLRVQDVVVGSAVADIIIAFLRAATSTGVRPILETKPAVTTFKWDTAGRGWDSGAPFLDARD